MKKLENLIDELNKEAYEHGRHQVLYDHVGGHHTVPYRQKLIGHEQIRAQVLAEILHIVKDLPESEEA